MKFINKEADAVREINEPLLHLSKDDELVLQLTKMQYKYDEPSWYLTADLSFKDATKIKVNIKDVGYIIAYFDKDFDNKLRKELIENIFELKKIDVNKSFDTLKKEVSSLLDLINECHPYFGIFMISNYHEEVEKILKEMEGSIFPIYYVDIEPEIKEEIIEEKPEVEEKDTLSSGFKKSLKNILKYKIEHAFNALYSMLIAICLLLATVYIDNNNRGIGLLFVFFTILFVVLIAYNLHLYYIDNKKISLFDYIFFVGFSLISIVIGILLGYALVKGLVKFGDTPINYSKNIKLAIILSIPTLLGAHLLRLLISFIYRKIKASK